MLSPSCFNAGRCENDEATTLTAIASPIHAQRLRCLRWICELEMDLQACDLLKVDEVGLGRRGKAGKAGGGGGWPPMTQGVIS